MEFRILGPLEVLADDRVLSLGGAKPRGILAALLLHANEAVSAERLAIHLWGQEAPPCAVKRLHVHVSRLRKALGDPELVATTSAGYCLHLRPGELDAQEFQRLTAAGRRALGDGDPEQAAALLHEALALWRGRPLADLGFASFAQTAIAELEEQRLSAFELRVEADLALDRHAELVPELQALAERNPTRERLHGQLMLALYQSGRQADALSVYQRVRHTLADQLGLQAGGELQELETRILRHDPLLGRPDRPRPAESAITESGNSTVTETVLVSRPIRSRRIAWLLVAGVVVAMIVLGGAARPGTEGAASSTSDAAYTAQVLRLCQRVNGAERAREDDAATLRTALRRAASTSAQREAILVAARASIARGDRNLADLRSIVPPAQRRFLHRATDSTWDRSLARLRAFAVRIDRAATRRELLHAMDRFAKDRPTWQSERINVTAGLQRLGGPRCRIHGFSDRPIALPELAHEALQTYEDVSPPILRDADPREQRSVRRRKADESGRPAARGVAPREGAGDGGTPSAGGVAPRSGRAAPRHSPDVSQPFERGDED
jgi:DNA-binding SARP family transcriptional activator